jgi:C4-dicarboxylate-specific signal transduction histidine kinase
VFSRDDKRDMISNTFKVNDSVKDALSLVGTQLKNHRIAVDLDLDNALPDIIGNSYRLEQVIINLLTNAKDALEEKRRSGDYDMIIKIKTLSENESVQIAVMDNGCGISKEVRNDIFNPFFTTKAPGEGTGLGLSVSYGIVKDLGGDMILCDEEEWTCFRVVLPYNR